MYATVECECVTEYWRYTGVHMFRAKITEYVLCVFK